MKIMEIMENLETMEISERIENFKKEFGINRLFSWETNPYYNSRFSNNGGGYSQPIYKGVIEWDNQLWWVNQHDTSCGDFGDRVETTISNSITELHDIYDGVGNDEAYVFSNIPQDFWDTFIDVRENNTSWLEDDEDEEVE